MKKIILTITLFGSFLSIKAQDETVDGKLTVDGHIYGKYLHTTDNNAIGALFTYPLNQNLYLGAGKDQNGNKNEIILYNLSCDGGCNVPKIRLLTDQIYTTGNFYQNISGTPSNWVYQINSSNIKSGFWTNNGNPALYLRDNSGNLNVVARPDGKSYFNGGNVGIGTSNPDAKLTVAGNIHSREVKVAINAGADFVFGDNYSLPSLGFIEKYIKENKHLPEISSEKEMKENGLLLAEMNIKLLQKIEELTLYTIKQQKEIEKLKSTNNKLIEIQVRLDKLESKK